MVTKRGCVRHKQWKRIGGILGECDEDSRRMEEGWKRKRMRVRNTSKREKVWDLSGAKSVCGNRAFGIGGHTEQNE